MKKQTGPKVVDRLLKNEDLSHIPAVKWGISKEDAARQAHIKEMVSSQSESILRFCGMDTKETGCAATVPKCKFYRKTATEIDKFLCAKLPSRITETLESSRGFSR